MGKLKMIFSIYLQHSTYALGYVNPNASIWILKGTLIKSYTGVINLVKYPSRLLNCFGILWSIKSVRMS